MDERDVRIQNLRAQVAGQEQTIQEQVKVIDDLIEQLRAARDDMKDLCEHIQALIDAERGKA